MFPEGFMHDAFTPGGRYGGDIILFARFNTAFLAMYLLDDYEGWDIHCQAAVVAGLVAPKETSIQPGLAEPTLLFNVAVVKVVAG